MNHYETIHTEMRNGFEIRLSIAPEDADPRDCFIDAPEEMADMMEKIDRGFYSWFDAKVSAHRAGIELGADYSGGNLYENPEDFIKKGGYFEDMIENAINEARFTIEKLNQEVTA